MISDHVRASSRNFARVQAGLLIRKASRLRRSQDDDDGVTTPLVVGTTRPPPPRGIKPPARAQVESGNYSRWTPFRAVPRVVSKVSARRVRPRRALARF